LNLDQSVSLDGTTVGATDDYQEFCVLAASAAPDVVYQVKIDQACSFFLDFTENGSFDGLVEIRGTTCGTESNGDLCINLGTSNETFKTELAAGTYSIIVDGATTDATGDFTLNLTCATPMCGDGILNSAEEQCDPGPANPNDSCGDPGQVDGCKIQSVKGADTCADINASTTTNLALNQTVFLPMSLPLYSSLDGVDDYDPVDPNCNIGSGAPDQVFKFTPAASGTLSITVGQDYNGMDYCQPPNFDQPECFIHQMWLRSTDCEAGTELACVWSDVINDNDVNTISATVTAGTSYFLFVEGDSNLTDQGENGAYLLKASLKP